MRRTILRLERLEPRRLLAAQAYDWNNVTIGGNGFVDGIVYAKAVGANDVAYAHTDIGGAYRLDPATNTWTPLTDWLQIGDPAQNNGAATMAVDPTNPNNVYLVAGTYQSNAVILRSSDQGRTWQRTDVSGIKVDGNGWGRGIGERLAVDPNLPSVLFYGANDFDSTHRGLWKSTDGAATWSQVGSFANYGDVWNGNYASALGVGLPFIIFDKTSSSPGTATQRIYTASDSSASTNTKLYTTSNGGTTWTPVPNQPTTTNFPLRAALSADGSVMYVTYGSQAGPLSSSDTGGVVYKITNPSSASPTWTVITPAGGSGIFTAIAIDPTNNNTIYTSTQNNFPSNIWRSTNGGTSWTALNPNNHRNDTSAPFAASQTVHWVSDIEVDPFNNNVAMFNTGYGIYRTTNLTAATPTWTFYNSGLEESAAEELVSPPSGSTHLYSAIGDRDGFKHDNLAVSPAQFSPSMGTSTDIALAWANTSDLVRVGNTSPYAQYSTNGGTSWTYFSAAPTGAISGGTVAISTDGAFAVWDPGDNGNTLSPLVYSTRSGSTWSAWTAPAAGTPPNGAIVAADLVAAQTFYAISGTTVSRSTDGGVHWTVMATTSSVSGASWLRAVPGQTGNLLISRGGNGLWRSIDGGATWSRINSGASRPPTRSASAHRKSPADIPPSTSVEPSADKTDFSAPTIRALPGP